MQQDSRAEIQKLFDDLMEEKERITKEASVLRAEYESLYETIHPLEKKAQEISRKIKLIEQPRMGEINTQLSGLAKALGGQRLSAPNTQG